MRFCTKFDHRYLDRGLALYNSIRMHAPNAELDVLAISSQCEEFLLQLNLPHLHVISIDKLLRDDKRLRSVRTNRSPAEFVFTLTPFICKESLTRANTGELVVYTDADAMLFGSPRQLERICEHQDVAVTPHNFSEHHKHKAKCGLYNTGWTLFRKSADGMKCVNWWADQCIEWCHDRVQGNRFADQKYIESFASVVPNVRVITHPGFNCAPWNSSFRTFRNVGGSVYVDGHPLIHFHFSHAKRVTSRILATRMRQQYVLKARGIRKNVYCVYAASLRAAQVKWKVPSQYIFGPSQARAYETTNKRLAEDSSPSFWRILWKVCARDYVFCAPLSC